MKCIDCGCTQECACIGFDGEPCHWATINPPVCSTCSDKRDLKEAIRLIRRDARELRASETVGGKWPKGTQQLQEECRELRRLAHRLEELRQKAGP